MTYFYYKAINPETKMEVSDNIEADSPRAVREHVRSLGLLPIIVREASTVNQHTDEQKNNSKTSDIKFNINDKIYFFSQLHVMFSAGLTLTDSLKNIAQHAPKAKIKKVAETIETDIRNGKTFTESIKKYTQSLGETAIGLCLTAEAAGQLDDVMGKIITILKKEKLVQSKLSTMMIYPILMMLLCIVLFFTCGLFIIPSMMKAFSIKEEDLTGSLKFIFDTCRYCADHWIALIVGICIVLIIIKHLLKMPSIKKFIDYAVMTIPILNEGIRYLNLSPFIAVLGLAYDAGLTIPSSISMAGISISNAKLREKAQKVVDLVVNGKLLSVALAEQNLVSPTFNALVVAGEQSGDLGKMFKEISDNIDQSIDDITAKLLEVIKIAVILIIGIFVLLLAPALMNSANMPALGF